MRCIKGLLPILAILAVQVVAAQNCLSTGLNGTVVNLPCNMTCSPFSFKAPHLKSTAEYTVVSIPYTPFPFIVNPVPGVGGEVGEVYIDDEFSSSLTLP